MCLILLQICYIIEFKQFCTMQISETPNLLKQICELIKTKLCTKGCMHPISIPILESNSEKITKIPTAILKFNCFCARGVSFQITLTLNVAQIENLLLFFGLI